MEPSKCSTPREEDDDLTEQIRRLEESHTQLQQEMKKIIKEREAVIQALKQRKEGVLMDSSSLQRKSAPGLLLSHDVHCSAIKRSMSMSPPKQHVCVPHKDLSETVRVPRRTLSENISLEYDTDSPEDRYANILHSMGQAVYMFSTSAEVTYWNSMAAMLYGWSAEEAVGRNIMELLVDKSSMETASKIVERLCVGESWVGQFPLKKKSGEIFPAMITNTPFYDSQGNLAGVIGVSSDARQFIEPHHRAVWKPHDWHQQPWQIPFASTLSSLATKLLSHLRGNLTVNTSGGETMRSTSWTGRLWPWKEETLHPKPRLGFEQLLDKLKPSMDGPSSSSSTSLLSCTSCCSSAFSNSDNNNCHSSMSSVTSTISTSSSSSRIEDLESPECEITWDTLTLHDQIGQGSCATVYRASWCGLDVAVKVFHELQYNESGLDDFRKEVAIMKKLRHPNIVLFLGAAASSERLYIVTELMPRGSLFRLLHHRKPSGLDWKRKLGVALDVAKGMTYLHNCIPPIVHRDLKSTNLLVDKNLKVKVGDFSLSRLKHNNLLTGNARMGTSQWMPPEVLRSESSNEKSDVYSFGVILWELATEEVPWNDLEPLQVIAVVGFKDKRLPIPENIDPKYAATIQDCWKSNWDERPSFEELTTRLKDMLRRIDS